MGLPGTLDLHLYAGDDAPFPLMFVAEYGRVVDDLFLTAGSNVATSPTAAFVQGDVGHVVVTEKGDGITDTCTILTVTNTTTVTLSEPATGTGEYVAGIRALDCSAWTAHLAQVRATTNDGDDPVLVSAQWDTTRDDVGVILMTFDAAATRTLGTGLIGTAEVKVGVYDMEAVDGDGELHTRLRGAVYVTPDVSRAP